MSDDEQIPQLMRAEDKALLRDKLAQLEKLEEDVAAGKVPKEEAESLLEQQMAEIEAILTTVREFDNQSSQDDSSNDAQSEKEPASTLDELPRVESGLLQNTNKYKIPKISANKTSLDASLDTLEQSLKNEQNLDKKETQENEQKVAPQKARRKSTKKKLRAPSKTIKRQEKKSFPFGKLAFVLIIAALVFSYEDIIAFVKQQQADLAAKNKPVISKKKEKPKPKKVIPKVVEKVEEEKVEEPQNFFQPTDNDLFVGEVKNHNFNQILTDKCINCHGKEGKEIEGDFNIAKLIRSKSLNSKHWTKIYRSIERGEMPPDPEDEEGAIPLELEEKDFVLLAIKSMFKDVKEEVITRVLTPYEIQNTMGDLFDIDFAMYNPFQSVYKSYSEKEFYTHQRKILSPHYLSNYYNVLYDTLQSFIGLRPQVDPMDVIVTFPSQIGATKTFDGVADLRWPQYRPGAYSTVFFKDVTERKKTKQDRRLDGNQNVLVNQELADRSLPPGTYTLRFTAEAANMNMSKITRSKYGDEIVQWYENFFEENQNLSLPVKFYLEPPGVADPFAKGKYLETMDISSEGEYAIEFTLNRRSGLAYSLDKNILGQYALADMIARHRFGDKVELKHLEVLRAEMASKPYDFPMVQFKDLRLEGPYNVKMNPLSFTQKEKINDMEVRDKFKFLHAFNGMKFSVIYTYLFKDLQKDKLKYEDAYRNAMIMFFMSSKFLVLNPYSKSIEDKMRFLSYTTHKSSPNPEFMEHYKKFMKKRDYQGFSNWLLEHENFRRFSEAFTYQWLKLGEIQNNQPDEAKYRNYYSTQLEKSHEQEAQLFMLNMFKENRPIKELVDSDYVFLDANLASFYGLPGRNRDLPSAEFTKVKITDENRGGLLGMGAFLTATGNGVDPLPLRRAAWISENLLDAPLPPPPDVDVNDFENHVKAKTLSERIAIHASNPSCNICHKRIDSLALMMDKYDTVGSFNNDYTPTPVKINDKKITNIKGFKEYIASYDQTMARAFSRKLISYMLGRDTRIQDEAKIDLILSQTKDNGYRLGDLYSSVVQHYFL